MSILSMWLSRDRASDQSLRRGQVTSLISVWPDDLDGPDLYKIAYGTNRQMTGSGATRFTIDSAEWRGRYLEIINSQPPQHQVGAHLFWRYLEPDADTKTTCRLAWDNPYLQVIGWDVTIRRGSLTDDQAVRRLRAEMGDFAITFDAEALGATERWTTTALPAQISVAAARNIAKFEECVIRVANQLSLHTMLLVPPSESGRGLLTGSLVYHPSPAEFVRDLLRGVLLMDAVLVKQLESGRLRGQPLMYGDVEMTNVEELFAPVGVREKAEQVRRLRGRLLEMKTPYPANDFLDLPLLEEVPDVDAFQRAIAAIRLDDVERIARSSPNIVSTRTEGGLLVRHVALAQGDVRSFYRSLAAHVRSMS